MSQQQIKLISHRGNIDGPNPERENSPSYIREALEKGFDVEADIWWDDYKISLGHDEPKYQINFSWLENKNLWLHAKNFYTLECLLDYPQFNCFYQTGKGSVLTTKNFIWSTELWSHKGVFVRKDFGVKEINVLNIYGICSDYVNKIRGNYE